MINFKKLREQALRQQQRHDQGLCEGDSVMSSRTGTKGTIHREWVVTMQLLYLKKEKCSVNGLRMLEL